MWRRPVEQFLVAQEPAPGTDRLAVAVEHADDRIGEVADRFRIGVHLRPRHRSGSWNPDTRKIGGAARPNRRFGHMEAQRAIVSHVVTSPIDVLSLPNFPPVQRRTGRVAGPTTNPRQSLIPCGPGAKGRTRPKRQTKRLQRHGLPNWRLAYRHIGAWVDCRAIAYAHMGFTTETRRARRRRGVGRAKRAILRFSVCSVSPWSILPAQRLGGICDCPGWTGGTPAGLRADEVVTRHYLAV